MRNEGWYKVSSSSAVILKTYSEACTQPISTDLRSARYIASSLLAVKERFSRTGNRPPRPTMATHHDGIFQDPNDDDQKKPVGHQTVRSDSSSDESSSGAFVDRTISVRDWATSTFEDTPGQLKSYVVSLFPIATWIYRYNFTWFVGDVSLTFFHFLIFFPAVGVRDVYPRCDYPLQQRV